jgi:hypothetical protein
VSKSSEPIVQLLVKSKIKESIDTSTPTSIDTFVTEHVVMEEDGKEKKICACSKCCRYLADENLPIEERKEVKGYVQLQEVRRELMASKLAEYYNCDISEFKDEDEKCIYCEKLTSWTSFALPGGAISWFENYICQTCVAENLSPFYRLNHCIECKICGTNSISVCGNSGNNVSGGLVWEAFPCACEKVRHILYDGSGPHVDNQIDTSNGLYPFCGDRECVTHSPIK